MSVRPIEGLPSACMCKSWPEMAEAEGRGDPSSALGSNEPSRVSGEGPEPLPGRHGGSVAMPEIEPNLKIPGRVKRALEEAKDFGAFRDGRPFVLLHLYCGPRDILTDAITKEARSHGLRTVVVSIDRKVDARVDLDNPKVWEELNKQADEGEFDYAHGGFPCGSFSRVRWSGMPGPPPVRSAQEIYGLSSNSREMQEEADKGTRGATATSNLVKRHCIACRARGIPELGTLENPPGDEVSGAAWDLPEIIRDLKEMAGETVVFNTCAFQTSTRRWFKKAKWGGKMEGGLQDLSKVCRCPNWVIHEKLVGKFKTEESGAYPELLCEEIAKKVVRAFKRCLNLEWWRHQLRVKGEEVSSLQKKWLENEEKKRKANLDRDRGIKRKKPERSQVEESETKMHSNIPRTQGKRSKKEEREFENHWAIGGMRNPDASINRLFLVKQVGQQLRDEWERFLEKNSRAIQVARDYGTEWAELDKNLVAQWENTIAKTLKAKEHEESTTGTLSRLSYQSPLNARLWDAWQKASKDPDNRIVEFIQRGVPLGMEEAIPPSNGVFPKVRDGEKDECEEAKEFETLRGLQNYVSVLDQIADAEIEIKRYESKGFVKRVPWAEVPKWLGPTGTVSKLALILKQKEDMSIKRRIVIDLKRSKGNSRAVVDERLILPRICDVLRKAQKMKIEEDILQKEAADRGDRGEMETEIYLIDLKDAFCHFAVRESELCHCVSPSTKEGEALVWVALLFGFKSAPLLMARLSAALGRLLASLVKSWECFVQIYVDDILLMVSGSRPRREAILSMVLYTLQAFGMMLSLGKGERGSRVTWIGTVIEISEDTMQFSIPEKMVTEVLKEIKTWPSKGMVSLKSVRTITGKLSWIAGILPRLRWVPSTFYGVMADVEKDQREGKESERASRRQDSRSKEGLVPVKRFGAALEWITKVLEETASKSMIRQEPLITSTTELGIISDASPFGVGALLIFMAAGSSEVSILEAMEANVTKEEAEMLSQDFGSSSSQAVMETFAILRALKRWQGRLAGENVMVKSDSTVALAIVNKLSSPTKELNYLGAEISFFMEKHDIRRLLPYHIPGKVNKEADWLSRPHERGPMPLALEEVKIKQLKPWKVEDFVFTPPGKQPEERSLPYQNAVWHTLDF